MIHLFGGYDEREAVGWEVFVSSVLAHTTSTVAFHRLDAEGLPEGSNRFTYSRFLVPWLSGYSGRAIFADACDMLMLKDVAELDALFDAGKAVQVVQHPAYETRHRLKYRGTDMECPNRNYPRKNWTSLMLINCGHPAWAFLTPSSIEAAVDRLEDLLQLRWLHDDLIGALPDRWNRLVDEGQAVDGAALCHWTAGIPGFAHYADAPGAELWHAQRARISEVSS